MLKISNCTSKKNLFSLLESATSEKGDLEIYIESLPAFMSTQIALTIFSYQVDKYPRTIIWKCKDKETADLLQVVGFKAVRKTTIPTIVVTETQTADTQAKEVPNISTQNIEKPNLPARQKENENKIVISSKHNPNLISAKNIINGIQTSTTKVQKEQIIENSKTIKNPAYGFNNWQQSLNTPRDRLSPGNITNEHIYSPSTLLGSNSPSNTDQDLDQWLKKIHFTKSAIDNLHGQNQENTDNTNISAELLRKQTTKTKKSLSKNFQLIVGAVLTTCIMILFLLIFPTTVYTVELNKILVEDSAELSFKTSDFNTKSVSLSTKSTMEATGTKEVETANAIGSAVLFNTSGNDLNLTNGGFYLVSGGKKYKHEFDANQGKVITIPARNDLNGPTVEIIIRAVEPGAGSNLSENTRFSIINLKEQNVGNALFGLSVTPIQNKELSGDKVATQSDFDLLKTTNEGKIAQNIGKEISNLQEEGVFTNADWYKQNSQELQYDSKIGEVKEKISLTTDSIFTIYTLPKELIEKNLKIKNSKIENLVEIVIKKQNGNFEEDKNIITLNLFYSYHEASQLDKIAISQTLKDKNNFNEVEQQLKSQYPEIKKIDKKDIGISLPMINPKIDINIVE